MTLAVPFKREMFFHGDMKDRISFTDESCWYVELTIGYRKASIEHNVAHGISVEVKGYRFSTMADPEIHIIPQKTMYEEKSEFDHFTNWNGIAGKIEWKSPTDLFKNPVFIDNTFVIEDIRQGMLGDCWFLAAVGGILEQSRENLSVCLPMKTDFASPNYNGTLEFLFYDHGVPTKVVINDKLPVCRNQLIFASSKNNRNEFWPSLLEKAFAVFQGGYKNIVGGNATEGLECLADMITQSVKLNDSDEKKLTEIMEMGIACCAASNHGSDTNKIKGIVQGHAYTYTVVKFFYGVSIIIIRVILLIR